MQRLRTLGIACVAVVALAAAGGTDEPSWAGRKVMPRWPGLQLTMPDTAKTGHLVTQPVESIVLLVLEDREGWLGVQQGASAGWLRKDRAVPVEDAVPYFTGRIRHNPFDDFAYACRGWAWFAREKDGLLSVWPTVAAHRTVRVELALADYAEAVRLAPGHAAWRSNQGLIYAAKRDFAKAAASYTEGIRLDPNNGAAYRARGQLYDAAKDYPRAAADYAAAVRCDAADVWSCGRLAALLASCPDGKVRDGERAVAYATRACRAADWKDPRVLATLAAAYAEAGDFAAAVRWQKQALEDPGYDHTDGTAARRRLRLYQDRKPYRAD